MDIKEIRELRSNSEKQIRDIIVNFCQQTGVKVTGCLFEVIHIQELGKERYVKMTGVVLDTES